MIPVCEQCGGSLQAVFPDLNRRQEDCQFEDCLHIIIGGSYGEYVDGSVKLCLCKDCAELFEKRNPELAAIMQTIDFDFRA